MAMAPRSPAGGMCTTGSRSRNFLRRAKGPCARRSTGRGALEAPRIHIQNELSQPRSEEHTSELQSRQYLVCRLLLEKKKKEMNNGSQNCRQHAPRVRSS